MTLINPDLTGFGQLYTRGANRSAQDIFGAVSVYLSDFTVVTFMKRGSGASQLVYNRSDNGGKSFDAQQFQVNGTPTIFDLIAARAGTAADGSPYYVLLENNNSILRSADFDPFVHPFDATFTRTTLGGLVSPQSAAHSLGVRGLNVVVAGQAGGGSSLCMWYSTDGGVTMTQTVPPGGLTVTAGSSSQCLASPADGIWLYINNVGTAATVLRSTDSGATWSIITTIPRGSASGLLSASVAILAITTDRLVAVFKGQIAISTDQGKTWTLKQNLTNPTFSPTDIRQADIAGFLDFGNLRGTHFLGAFSVYVAQIAAGTTVKSAWRSVDLGETWSLVDVVGGLADAIQPWLTSSAARNGRGVVNIYNNGDFNQRFWYNESAGPGIGQLEVAGLGDCSSFGVCPCHFTCD